MAEGEGFEPPVPFQAQRFSRPPVSTTHTSLRAFSNLFVISYLKFTTCGFSHEGRTPPLFAARRSVEALTGKTDTRQLQPEGFGVELHHFGEVGKKIRDAMVSWV